MDEAYLHKPLTHYHHPVLFLVTSHVSESSNYYHQAQTSHVEGCKRKKHLKNRNGYLKMQLLEAKKHLSEMWSPDLPCKAILFFLFDFTIKGLHLKSLHKW